MAMFLSRIKKALNLGTKNITINGTYNASSDGYDGYSSVEVNVAGVTPTPITPSNNPPVELTANTAVTPSANGYAISYYSNVTTTDKPDGHYGSNSIVRLVNGAYLIHDYVDVTASDSDPAYLDNAHTYVLGSTYGYLYRNLQPTPTNITPSNSTPVSLSSGSIYKPSASGYAISSYSSKTPSDSSPASVSSGAIIKASSSGYLYSTQQPKVKIGTVTTSTTATTYVNIGFKPKYIAFVDYKDSTHLTLSIYNQDISAGATYRGAVNGTSQNCASFSLPQSSTSTNAAKILSIDSTGFTIDKTSSNFGTNAYYFAIG